MPKKAEKIVQAMLKNDAFSHWLGIEVVSLAPGTALLKMKIKPEMLNGFGIAHGGITYALADSALAFASNGHGVHSLSIETSISHFAKVLEGEIILAEATEENRSHKVATYRVEVFSAKGEKKALFSGTVYRSSKEWDV